MSALYIHVPYCKKVCCYCDFHFSLNLKTRSQYVEAVCRELHLRRNEIQKPIETVYFGGGTPSVLTKEELGEIFAAIHNNYTVLPNAEISFECNPDDISEEYCADLLSFGINRLSIGIQSFSDDDLQMLNRRHDSESNVVRHVLNHKHNIAY